VLAAKCVMEPFVVDPTIIEAYGAWLSIKLGKQIGHPCIVIEGDSLEIVQALRREGKCWSIYGPFINDAKSIILEFSQWDVHHVWRNANEAIHKLAKMALVIGQDGMWHDSFPGFIHDIVRKD
jgi:hypothetical protein